MAEYDLGTARGKIEIDSSGAEAGALRAGKSVDSLSGNLDKASSSMVRTGAVMGGVGAAAAIGFGVAINAAANFESRISAIGAVTGASAEDLDKFRQLALQLGADTKFSAGEAATAIEELAKAGISLPDIMNGAAAAVTDLAAAGEVDLARAAEITSNAMNSFGISGEDAAHVADVFAQAANTSAADVEGLGQSLSQVSAVASLVGLSFEDTINALSQFADQGLKGSDAGTSLKTALMNLQPMTKQQIELFDELGITTDGMNNKFFDSAGKLKPLVEIQKVLQEATKGMTEAERLATLERIGGSDAVRALGILTKGNVETTIAYGEALNKEGAAQETAKKKMDNLKGSLEQLKGSFETAMIRIGQLGQGPVRAVVDFLTGVVNGFMNLSPAMQQFIVGATLALGVLVGMAGTFLLVGGGILKLISTFRQLKAALEVVKGLQLMTKAMTALNASFLANPVFLIIAGLVALGVALVVLYKKSETFRNIIDSIGRVIAGVFGAVKRAIGSVVEAYQQFQKAGSWEAHGPFERLGVVIAKVVNFFKELIGGVKAFVAAFKAGDGDITSSGFPGFMERVAYILRKVFDFVVNNWPTIIAVIMPFIGIPLLIIRNWSGIVNFFQELPGKIVSFFASLPGRILGFFGMLLSGIVSFGASFLGAIGSFLISLPGKFVEAFGFVVGFMVGFVARMVVEAVQLGVRVLTAIGTFLASLPGRFAAGFLTVITAAISFGTQLLTTIVGFLLQLPGKFLEMFGFIVGFMVGFAARMIVEAVQFGTNFITSIINFLIQLPGRIWDILTTVITNVVTWVGDMIAKAIDLGTRFLAAIVEWFTQLPGRIWDFLTDAASKVATWVSETVDKAIDLGTRFLAAIVEWFSQLPGRIWEFIQDVSIKINTWRQEMVEKAIDLGTRFVNAIIDWFQQLPGRIAGFLSDIISNVAGWVSDMWNKAVQAGRDFYNGLVDGIQGLPGAVGDILDKVIAAIKSVISRAFEAVKDFARSMWNGFKAGLGISSPSYIEHAMWDLVGNVTDSTKDLKGQIGLIQKMAKVNFGEFGPAVSDTKKSAETLEGMAATVVASIHAAADRLRAGIQSVASGAPREALAALAEEAKALPETIATAMEKLVGAIQTHVDKIFDAVKSLVAGLMDSTSNLGDQLNEIKKLAFAGFGEGGPTVGGSGGNGRPPMPPAASLGLSRSTSPTAATMPTTTFNNVFQTNADPTEISQQIMWDQRVRVRGGS